MPQATIINEEAPQTNDRLQILDYLIKENDFGLTPLHRAAAIGDAEKLEQWLNLICDCQSDPLSNEKVTQIIDFMVKDEYRNITPLCLATIINSLDTCKVILKFLRNKVKLSNNQIKALFKDNGCFKSAITDAIDHFNDSILAEIFFTIHYNGITEDSQQTGKIFKKEYLKLKPTPLQYTAQRSRLNILPVILNTLEEAPLLKRNVWHAEALFASAFNPGSSSKIFKTIWISAIKFLISEETRRDFMLTIDKENRAIPDCTLLLASFLSGDEKITLLVFRFIRKDSFLFNDFLDHEIGCRAMCNAVFFGKKQQVIKEVMECILVHKNQDYWINFIIRCYESLFTTEVWFQYETSHTMWQFADLLQLQKCINTP
jgi:hypothetical protein